MKELVKFHQNLLGLAPTPKQVNLYQAKMHGISSSKLDREIFLATFVMGLYHARNGSSFRDVIFAVPTSMETWTTKTLRAILQGIVRSRRSLPKEQRVSGNKVLIEAMSHIKIGSRVFSMNAEPTHWVAFGFTRETVAPEWLKNGLL